ncbi:hypothetical protein TBLA_0D05550 [Henningerozyma blattae CBS 6284]|uniref:Enoyl reductase (ER) domain-containing protein n=1 Tax=Henningerozyma blattae (strain ATCC 34711 / CBS 6284 / DSM 70876 / NBRC 10599 / NRRL Y-10934 / UCD 77-7) TaxID=1071380 RepID=I2H3U5_HENB6|nr:hypothetical protein TBLA_0D05550 [Tetrapisispora blattae CBS 6284]CCH61047.1 hypothetical protein TBLA_0D05550 [Tetrapisispora blattae CBS 6284]
MVSIPTAMKAIRVRGSKAVLESNVPLPEIEDGYFLIKVIAVAANPTDWKHVTYKIAPQGAISGCDCVGEIVKFGQNVDTTKFSIGDKVYGFIHGGSVRMPTNGAFAEYASMDSQVAYRAPKDLKISGKLSIPEGPCNTLESLATLPVSLGTAGLVLTDSFKIKMEWEPAKVQKDEPVLIWGGATAVGEMIIQLSKKMNAFSTVIVVASKKHEKKLKEYGADVLFDYHDSDVINQITKKYPNIRYLIDCVSNRSTIQQVYSCASLTEPATVLNLVGLTDKDIDEKIRRIDVKMITTLMYCVLGHPVPFLSFTLPADPAYREAGIKFYHWIEPKVSSGEIRHIPVKIYPNGLESIPEMLNDLETGKVSGEKLVTVL